MQRIAWLLYIVFLVPCAAMSCSYPSLVPTCERIAAMQATHWAKASQWRAVLLSLDLNSVSCDDNSVDNSVKKLLKVTSADAESLFDFNFTGSVDEQNRFSGEGKKVIGIQI